jgi:hypothetical protein
MQKEINSPSRVHVHPGRSGVMHVTLPDKTALFVASYLHQLRVIHGMDLTIDQAIWICEELPDILGRYCYLFHLNSTNAGI